jgi:transposase
MRSNKQTSGERIVKDIKRQTRKQYSAEEKIQIVLDGLRGEKSIAELCQQEGIAQGLYYKWSKDFLEAGKKRLAGDIVRQATSTEVTALKAASEFKDSEGPPAIGSRARPERQR